MTIQCKVKSIQPLACNTYQILLHPESPVPFKAGQYLMVVMGEKDKRPSRLRAVHVVMKVNLELHIGAAEHNAYALESLKQCKRH
ncbi:FMN reductase [Vibrio harveyi]|nr:FMN reductase [Vibrio harveyi]